MFPVCSQIIIQDLFCQIHVLDDRVKQQALQGFVITALNRSIDTQLPGPKFTTTQFGDRLRQRVKVYRQNSGSTDMHRRFHGCSKRQVGNLSRVRQIGRQVVVISRMADILDHFQCTLRVGFQEAVHSQVAVRHFIQAVQAEVAQARHDLPIIETNVEFFPGSCETIAHPRKVFAEMRIPRNGKQAEVVKDAARQRFKFGIKFKESCAKQRIEILSGSLVMHRDDPGEMVCPHCAYIQEWNHLIDHAVLQRVLGHIGLHTKQPLRHFNPQFFGERRANHAISGVDLMT